MVRNFRGFAAAALLSLAISIVPAAAGAQSWAPRSPSELLDAWVELWGSYDLDVVPLLFLRDDRLTYFSSELEGLLRGYERILEHHRGFGFVPGGTARDRVIWVGDVEIADFGETALVGAIWHFGDPSAPAEAQRGPMSLLAVRTPAGYRIAHMHFATYEAAAP